MRKGTGRKLLVASIGVASVSYVACFETSGNLLPPPKTDGSADATAERPPDTSPDRMDALVANLMAPPDATQLFDIVANLVPTPTN